jgi:hypothetical protein
MRRAQNLQLSTNCRPITPSFGSLATERSNAVTFLVAGRTLVSNMKLMPAFTHGQIRNSANKPAMPTKAEIQNMVQAIIGSKPKVQAYCQLSKLYDQLTDANARREKKDVRNPSGKR